MFYFTFHKVFKFLYFSKSFYLGVWFTKFLFTFCEVLFKLWNYFEFWFEFLNFKFARFDLFHIPACLRIWNYFHTRFDFLEFLSFEFLDSRFEFEFKFSRVCDFYIVGCSRKRKKEKEAKRKKENILNINLYIKI